jgi:hypothetical protein
LRPKRSCSLRNSTGIFNNREHLEINLLIFVKSEKMQKSANRHCIKSPMDASAGGAGLRGDN